MEQREPASGGEDREREEELRALARVLRGGEAAGETRPLLVAGRFELDSLLGSGPHGQVFRARDLRHQGRALALKRLYPAGTEGADFLPRLEQHLEELRALGHEGIVRPRAAGRDGEGRIYVAGDLVQGESLRALLDRRGALPPRHALEIARQVLSALEAGHARGLAHGAITAENVLLAGRIPWTEENPFGVGVRLADFGLAALLGRADASPEHDLFDVGLLLAELATGTRLSSGSRDWPGIRATLPGANLRGLLDRSLAPAPEGRFPSARAFRAAIEGSADWRPARSRAPARVERAAAVGALALALVSFLLFLRERGRSVQASSGPHVAAEVARLAQALRSADEERGSLAGELSALESERDELLARSRAEEERGAELARRARELEQTVEERDSELAAARAALESRQQLPGTLEPSSRACAAFDRLLERLESGDLEAARAVLEAARTEPALQGLGFERRFLAGGLEAAERIEEAARSQELWARAGGLTEARAALARAGAEREAFLLAAAPWLELPLGARPQRRVDCERWFEGLERARREQAQAIEPELSARWSALAGGPSDVPREVLALARWFDDGRLAGYLERLAADLSARCEPGGRLELEPLRSAATLEQWGALASGDEAFLACGPGATEVLRFAFARRFAFPLDASEVLPPWSCPEAPGPPGKGGWREAQALRARALAPRSAYPGGAGSSRLYRVRASGGEESWILETVLDDPPDSAGARWTIEQRFFDGAGRASFQRLLTVERRGKLFFEQDVRRRALVDLSWDGARVHAFEPELEGEVPERLGFPAGEVARFRSELARSPPRALVVEEDGSETWLAAELGLVRYRAPDRIVRELVYAELP